MMSKHRTSRGCVVALVMAVGCATVESRSDLGGAATGSELGDHPDSMSRVIGELTAMLDRNPILALCENHGSETQHVFIRDLIADSRFTDRVDDIVVEFATAGRQHLIDRYIGGEDVSLDELASAWRDIGAVHLPWESPVYPAFFEHVRSVNEQLAKSGSRRRLRVLGGDPPIDWSKINTFKELSAYYNDPQNERDVHMAGVIRREVLDRGRRALVLAGNGHLTRRNLWEPPAPHPSPDTTTVRLERETPGSTSVVLSLGPSLLADTELGTRLSGVQTPQLLPTSARVFEGVPAGRFTTVRRYNAPPDKALAFPGLVATDIADAVLYLRPADRHRSSVYGVATLESMDLTEINRRRTIARRGPVTVEDLLQESAEVTLAEGRTATSLPIWQRLVERKPKSPEFHAGLAQTLAKLDMRQAAIDAFRRAVELGRSTGDQRVSEWRRMANELADGLRRPDLSPPKP